MSPANEPETLAAGDLTGRHVGRVVLGVPGVAGWERNLLLQEVDRRRHRGQLWLGFRWNDDPNPSNTKRGQFAIGVRVSPDLIVRVTEAGDA